MLSSLNTHFAPKENTNSTFPGCSLHKRALTDSPTQRLPVFSPPSMCTNTVTLSRHTQQHPGSESLPLSHGDAHTPQTSLWVLSTAPSTSATSTVSYGRGIEIGVKLMYILLSNYYV